MCCYGLPRFRQIVYSLLSNAIKFTPEKGAVSVTLTSRSDSGLIELTVRDTGIGISEDHIANLFSVHTHTNHTPLLLRHHRRADA